MFIITFNENSFPWKSLNLISIIRPIKVLIERLISTTNVFLSSDRTVSVEIKDWRQSVFHIHSKFWNSLIINLKKKLKNC